MTPAARIATCSSSAARRRGSEEPAAEATIHCCEQRCHRRGRVDLPELPQPCMLVRQSEVDVVRLGVPGEVRLLDGDRLDQDAGAVLDLVLVVWKLRVVRQPPEPWVPQLMGT